MNVGELSQGIYYIGQHKKMRTNIHSLSGNQTSAILGPLKTNLKFLTMHSLLSYGVDFRPCCRNLTPEHVSYTWNRNSKLWVQRTLSLEHLMQGEGHFLGYPWHLQTLPFRFSEFTKAPSDYLQQAPVYLKNWLGRRKTRDTYKGFSEYKKGELYELLRFQNNRLCQTSNSSLHGYIVHQ